MNVSVHAHVDRRALAAQHEARVKEVMAQAKSMQSIMSAGRRVLQVRVRLV
jgi:hypothetical protein